MISRAQFVGDMLSWVNTRLAPPGITVHAQTPLFASGVVSSIKVLDLIAWTERAISREVSDTEIRLDNFRTVARIADFFVGEEHHAII